MCLSSLFCFHGNIGLQGIEATFPELPILLKPHIGLPERARPKAAYMLSTSDLAMYKAGALQHHHVLRNCVEGDWEGPRDLANRGRPSRKNLHDRAPCWISDCRKDIVQMIPMTINHMVEHNDANRQCQFWSRHSYQKLRGREAPSRVKCRYK